VAGIRYPAILMPSRQALLDCRNALGRYPVAAGLRSPELHGHLHGRQAVGVEVEAERIGDHGCLDPRIMDKGRRDLLVSYLLADTERRSPATREDNGKMRLRADGDQR